MRLTLTERVALLKRIKTLYSPSSHYRVLRPVSEGEKTGFHGSGATDLDKERIRKELCAGSGSREVLLFICPWLALMSGLQLRLKSLGSHTFQMEVTPHCHKGQNPCADTAPHPPLTLESFCLNDCADINGPQPVNPTDRSGARGSLAEQRHWAQGFFSAL